MYVVRPEEHSWRHGVMIKEVMSIVSRTDIVGDKKLGSLHKLAAELAREQADWWIKRTREGVS